MNLTFPAIMGILNVTPDSFWDGGRFNTKAAALTQARAMCEAGATLIDVGGESTRPGAKSVTLQEELDRVIPMIEMLSHEIPAVISVDTSQPMVMQEAINAGARFINDVRALQIPGGLEIVSQARVPVCLMHMQGNPHTMQEAPFYQDVIQEVKRFLLSRIDACLQAGILPENIVIDPGFGFGKTLRHNLTLLRNLTYFKTLGYPILVGLSRKRMIGEILNVPVEKRMVGSLVLTILAILEGASMVRVHDVQETGEALRILRVLNEVDHG